MRSPFVPARSPFIGTVNPACTDATPAERVNRAATPRRLGAGTKGNPAQTNPTTEGNETMTDNYPGQAKLNSPGIRHNAIVASADELDPKPRAVCCIADGDITIEDVTGHAETYTMTSGQILPFRAHKVTAISGGEFAAWD